MRRIGSILLVFPLAVGIAGAAASHDLAASLKTLQTVAGEGSNNSAAGSAWKKIVNQDEHAIPLVLHAMDGANDLGLNWLRAAVDTLAANAQARQRPLPVSDLEKFVRDRQHHPRARRLAYELVAGARPELAERLVATMLDDPANELRRDAVERVVLEAGTLRSTGQTNAANAKLQLALRSARDVDQIESIAKSLRDAGQVVDLPGLFGWLSRWKVIGPFDNPTNGGFDRVYPPEQKIDLAAEYAGKTGTVRWQNLSSTNEYGLIDLNVPCGSLKSVAGYTYTEFYLEKARPVELRLGSKNGWKIWLNNRFVFGREEYHRGAEIDQYRLPVELKAGKNTILVKLTQNEMVEEWTREWEFQLRITDSSGTPITPARAPF